MRGLGFWTIWPAAILSAAALSAQTDASAPPGDRWYFALSGDSRDCGDLIMPKIAHDIEANLAAAPVEFYWHLGDLRRMYDIDCDMLLRSHPRFDCRDPREGRLGRDDMGSYLATAWDDVIAHQLAPFGTVQVFLGIGNHELYANRTREDFRAAFRRWLTQEPLHAQRMADASKGVYGEEGDTYYHWVAHGVDFISLDNADTAAFSAAEITWLASVLALDAADDSIKAIVVGMHEALPYSTGRSHAMDASCQGLCSGKEVYDMLFGAQHLGGPPAEQKHVYVFASHSHYFAENIYDTPEHRGQVLPGWIVGTAGAQQYVDTIRYGYLRVEVRRDGTLAPLFRAVTRDSLPLASGAEADNLTAFCFLSNKDAGKVAGGAHGSPAKTCACGAVR
ncbi:MAG: hypothetical protein ACHQQS_09330 [Thermoanaerobaculales bacterium]